jgi:phosphatidylinositol alpha-mannosyltransferase
MPPLSVAIVTTYDVAHEGGVKQNAFAVAEVLRRRGDQVTIIAPASRAVDEPDLHAVGGIVRIHANGSDNDLSIFTDPFDLRRLFAARRFDLIQVHEPLNPSLGWWAAWLAPSTPHVATFHAYGEREPRALGLARRLLTPLIRPYYQRAFAVSEAARSWAGPSWGASLSIIPNGVDLDAFHPGDLPPADALRLLFVGRLDQERKGFAHLHEAFLRLRARGVAVTLDVVGERGAAIAPAGPGIIYHGAVPATDLAARYRACDVFVAPSTGQESFGIVLLEAMASGRPIIASDISGYARSPTRAARCSSRRGTWPRWRPRSPASPPSRSDGGAWRRGTGSTCRRTAGTWSPGASVENTSRRSPSPGTRRRSIPSPRTPDRPSTHFSIEENYSIACFSLLIIS